MKQKLCIRLLLAVLVVLSHFSCFSQVKGYVLDQKGDPLPFATILIEGSSAGTSANLEGYYELKLPERGDFNPSACARISVAACCSADARASCDDCASTDCAARAVTTRSEISWLWSVTIVCSFGVMIGCLVCCGLLWSVVVWSGLRVY